MEKQEIILHPGEKQEIRLESRGASGLQLLFTVSDTNVLSVTQRELTDQELDKLPRQAGGSRPAIFVIMGIKVGHSDLHFYEKPAAGRQAPDLTVQDYSVTVKE